MASRRRNGNDGTDIVLAKERVLQSEHTTHGATDNSRNLLDTEVVQDELVDVHVVPHGSEREFRSIVAILRLTILVGDRARTTVRAAQAVQADDEEPGDIKGLTRSSEEWAPPIGDIGTPTQSVADHQGIVALGRQNATGRIGDRHIVKSNTGLEGEGGNDRNGLFLNQGRIWVLRLGIDSLYGI